MSGEDAELQHLRQQIRDARKQILSLVVEREDVLLQQLPQVEADYQLKIGVYEKRLLEAELACLRAKRKCALAQQAINQGRSAAESALESQLDQEFSAWQKRLGQMTEHYLQTLGYRASMVPMTRHQGGELKKLFTTLVKRLHPDTCVERSEYMADLFATACSAYKHGDLVLLRSIEVATQELDHGSQALDASLDSITDPDQLEVMLVSAQAQVDVMEDELQKALQTPPLPLREQLRDGAWVAKKVGAFKKQIRSFDDVRVQYERRLEQMRKAGYVR